MSNKGKYGATAVSSILRHKTLKNDFYFSVVSFSTLGLSSFQPTDAFKIITGLEALTGFLLITWSASFGYTAMKGFWQEADVQEEE